MNLFSHKTLISPMTAGRSKTSATAPSKNISYNTFEELRQKISKLLKSSSQPAVEIGTAFAHTNLAAWADLPEKGPFSQKDMRTFLRIPNKIIRDKQQAATSEQLILGFYQALISASPAEQAYIIPLFKQGFYGISSHPDNFDRTLAVSAVEQAERCFFQYFKLFFNEFSQSAKNDIIWKRLEEFIRIVILPLADSRPQEAGAVPVLDPLTFSNSLAYKLGQEWAKDHGNRLFDDRRSTIWGAIFATLLNSCERGAVHQLYNNGQTASSAAAIHFILLPLLAEHPAAIPTLAAKTGLTCPLTGKEKVPLNRPQLASIAQPIYAALEKQPAQTATEWKQHFLQIYSDISTSLFISPSQAMKVTAGLKNGLAFFDE